MTAHGFHSLQHINAPDFDLERDIVPLEELYGMEVANMQAKKKEGKFKINVETIIISALIFLAILAWFDYIQTAFYFWAQPEEQKGEITPSTKFWYAIFITILVIILVYIVHRLFEQKD